MRSGAVPHDVKAMAGSVWDASIDTYKRLHPEVDATELWDKPLLQNQHLQYIKMNMVIPALLERCAVAFGHLTLEQRKHLCDAAAVYKIISKRTALLSAQKQATVKRVSTSYAVRRDRPARARACAFSHCAVCLQAKRAAILRKRVRWRRGALAFLM